MNETKTREYLTAHYRAYPNLEIQDIFKFLHQSSFGCEHMITSSETVIQYIQEEYNQITHGQKPMVETLDGAYFRVSLSHLDAGLRPETLGKLFCLSAKQETTGTQALEQKLVIAKKLIQEGKLPFHEYEFEQARNEWKEKGYPAIHHSDSFRKAYQPAYRVIAKEYIPFLTLFAELDKHLAKGSVKLAIDGGSASGKTTLSQILARLYDCTVFHMDDFFLQPHQRTPERYVEVGGNVDRERFLEEVLEPLKKEEDITYRTFDCSSMSLTEAVTVQPEKLIVVEGAYAMHPAFSSYYDVSVFLDVAPELQKERIQKRNTPALAQRFFSEWIPLETRYFTETNIKERCGVSIRIT